MPKSKKAKTAKSKTSIGKDAKTRAAKANNGWPPIEKLDQPLTYEEQEALSEVLNDLPESLLPGVIEILKKAGLVTDEEELNMNMDDLDEQSQRELHQLVVSSEVSNRFQVSSARYSCDALRPTYTLEWINVNFSQTAHARRVSDVSSSRQERQQDEDGITRAEFTELFHMIQNAQNSLFELHEELTLWSNFCCKYISYQVRKERAH